MLRVRSREKNSSTAERVKGWLGKYVGKQEMFGLTLNLEALKAEFDIVDVTSRRALKGLYRKPALVAPEIPWLLDSAP